MSGKAVAAAERYLRDSKLPEEVKAMARETIALVLADTRERMSALRNENLALARRVGAAEQIMARLPKTADGVPVVPGMTLHVDTGMGVYEMRTFNRLDFDRKTVVLQLLGTVGDTAHEVCFGVSRCYSTREAADAGCASRAAGEGVGRGE